MQFADIPGKAAEKDFLIKSVKEDRIAHAQLFLGRPGSGQLALALAYGTYLQCNHRTDTDSCGKCPSCLKNAKYAHPDFHFAFPVIKKGDLKRKDTTSNDFLPEWRSTITSNPYLDMDYWIQTLHVENQQPDINTKECLDIIRKLSLKAFESTYKVILIWMPEYLKKEGNRLLKIIEEPTDNTVILLVAERPEEILGTILSRTQLIKVSPFSDQDVSEYLLETHTQDPTQAQQVAKIAEGNMSMAISRVDGSNMDFSENMISWLRTSYKLDPVELSKWVDQMNRNGREIQKSFLKYVITFLREYILSFHHSQYSPQLSEAELKLLHNLGSLLTPEVAESITALLNESIGHISRNANGKIIFMSNSVSIGRMLRSKKADRLLFQ